MVCLTAEKSLDQFIDRAVRRYSSLFGLPSYMKVIFFLASSCIVGTMLSTITLFPFPTVLRYGLMIGIPLLLANLILDHFVSMIILKLDPIYDFRRTAALSFFSLILWFSFILTGLGLSSFFGLSWWLRLCLIGFSAVLTLRLTVFHSTSSAGYVQLLMASLLQPVLTVIPFLILWKTISNSFVLAIYPYLIVSSVVSIVSNHFFIYLINRVGREALRIPSLSFFKAFLLNWIVGLNAPFEELLEKLGEEQDVEISLIKFETSRPKAAIVVPSVHPGPFKNVGSSLLPSLLKAALEKELGCVVGVPHGLLGHELDLVSETQSQKVIDEVVKSAKLRASETSATPFVKVSNDLATVCCQIFGKSAFVSLTLAPETTEDFPQELGSFVRGVAEEAGFEDCMVVNAHNSIDGTTNIQDALCAMRRAATDCLEQAKHLAHLPFEIGASSVLPEEFGIKEGMGPGGISVIVIKVGEQKTSYVVIDGNNMVSGLREKILSSLRPLGSNGGEVFTTDTHAVNALILDKKGYNPIGEVINHERLVDYINTAAFAAISNLEPAKAVAGRVTVRNVKVIGEERVKALCLLADMAVERAKRIIIPVFGAAGLVLMVFSALFLY